MARSTADLVAALAADPRHGAVVCDIDGTLAPIVQHAAEAHVPEATRLLLIRIARRCAEVWPLKCCGRAAPS